jgi:prefoldin subunit 5
MDLYAMTKEQLISEVQDYQELISEIEGVINAVRDKPECLLQVRDTIDHFMMGGNDDA